ncbi:MAG: hypothetical protein ACK4RT_09075 [Erythrobacter sp.]
MIRVTAASAGLVKRLQRRARNLAERYLRAARKRKRSGWHSAEALWPDFVEDKPRR